MGAESSKTGASSSRSPESSEEEEENPGETPIWFGALYRGQRFDTIPRSYIRWCLLPEQTRFEWYDDFRRLNSRYDIWLARQNGIAVRQTDPDGRGIGPSTFIWNPNLRPIILEPPFIFDPALQKPGGAIVNFGQYKGLRFDQIEGRKGYMRFLLKKNPNRERCRYYLPLLELYKLYKERERRPYQSRQRGQIENPVGDATGIWDDYNDAPPPDDQYEEDGFVVSDDHESQGDAEDAEDEDETQELEEDSGPDFEPVYCDESQNAIAGPSGTRASTEASDSTSEDNSADVHTGGEQKSSSDSDSDDDTPLTMLGSSPVKCDKRATRKDRKGKRRAMSDDEDQETPTSDKETDNNLRESSSSSDTQADDDFQENSSFCAEQKDPPRKLPTSPCKRKGRQSARTLGNSRAPDPRSRGSRLGRKNQSADRDNDDSEQPSQMPSRPRKLPKVSRKTKKDQHNAAISDDENTKFDSEDYIPSESDSPESPPRSYSLRHGPCTSDSAQGREAAPDGNKPNTSHSSDTHESLSDFDDVPLTHLSPPRRRVLVTSRLSNDDVLDSGVDVTDGQSSSTSSSGSGTSNVSSSTQPSDNDAQSSRSSLKRRATSSLGEDTEDDHTCDNGSGRPRLRRLRRKE